MIVWAVTLGATGRKQKGRQKGGSTTASAASFTDDVVGPFH
ncbi:MAG: hypothetical protein ACRD2U_11240 [Terriglobales bacterium]